MVDRTLPTLAPQHMMFEIHNRGHGVLDLTTWAGDGPGFRTASGKDLYEALTASEVVDVISAIVDGAHGPIVTGCDL